MKIELIAHDKKKEEIIQLAKKYKDVLANYELYATGTTGTFIMGETVLPIHRMKSGHLSGGCNSGGDVTVRGSFSGGCNTGGDITCGGNFSGDINFGGEVTVKGDVKAEKIKGNVVCNSLTCDKVEGNITINKVD